MGCCLSSPRGLSPSAVFPVWDLVLHHLLHWAVLVQVAKDKCKQVSLKSLDDGWQHLGPSTLRAADGSMQGDIL